MNHQSEFSVGVTMAVNAKDTRMDNFLMNECIKVKRKKAMATQE